MVHAKLYLVDDTLGIGSPRLTIAGVESRSFVLDLRPEVVEKVARQIEKMCVGTPGFSKRKIFV